MCIICWPLRLCFLERQMGVFSEVMMMISGVIKSAKLPLVARAKWASGSANSGRTLCETCFEISDYSPHAETQLLTYNYIST